MKRFTITCVALFTLFTLFVSPALAEKPQLGVFLQELDDDLRDKFDFKGDGVLVTDTVDDSGADEAGIESGDIIIMFNGNDVSSSKTLRKAIQQKEIGDKVKVKVFRDGKMKDIQVILKEKKEKDWNWTMDFDGDDVKKFMFFGENKNPWIGIVMDELNDQLLSFFKTEHGVLIKEVVEDSPAEKAGLKAGDVLIYFADEKIDDIDDVFEELDDYDEGDKVDLWVVRNGGEKKFTVELGEKADHGLKSFKFQFDGDNMNFAPFHGFGDDEIDILVDPDIEDMEKEIHIIRKEKGEYKEEMEELKKEMEELKRELKEMKESK